MFRQVGSSIGRLQEDAKAIKNDLSAMHSQHKSRQTSKILSDFEVGVLRSACLSKPVLLKYHPLASAMRCHMSSAKDSGRASIWSRNTCSIWVIPQGPLYVRRQP